jgi:riboflavin kinase/FMN adenylyltransferase
VDVVRGLENWTEGKVASSVALGFFDGVHRGHQKIIATAVQAAKEHGLRSLVVTFEPHPLAVLRPAAAPLILTPFQEKARLIKELGADTLLVLNFTPYLAALEAKDFVRNVLVETLSARHVTVGYNYTFGREGQGTPEALAAWGREFGFAVNRIPPVCVNGEPVSSSRIRELLAQGELEKAASFLGRFPAVVGRVVPGARRGRSLGFPTANIELGQGLALPRFGVYAVRTWHQERCYAGVANIGCVPTFGAKEVRLEVHLFDFLGNLYGKHLRVEFIAFLRPEQMFNSTEDLKVQLERDARQAKDILRRLEELKSSPALFTTTGVCDRI